MFMILEVNLLLIILFRDQRNEYISGMATSVSGIHANTLNVEIFKDIAIVRDEKGINYTARSLLICLI